MDTRPGARQGPNKEKATVMWDFTAGGNLFYADGSFTVKLRLFVGKDIRNRYSTTNFTRDHQRRQVGKGLIQLLILIGYTCVHVL